MAVLNCPVLRVRVRVRVEDISAKTRASSVNPLNNSYYLRVRVRVRVNVRLRVGSGPGCLMREHSQIRHFSFHPLAQF